MLEDRFRVGGIDFVLRTRDVSAFLFVLISNELLLVAMLERSLCVGGIDLAVIIGVTDRTDLDVLCRVAGYGDVIVPSNVIFLTHAQSVAAGCDVDEGIVHVVALYARAVLDAAALQQFNRNVAVSVYFCEGGSAVAGKVYSI